MPVLPRRPNGPPLTALRAFEAAARLGSFIAASEELSVTPGAVSQHVKSIEAWAGVTVFRRSAQGVSLTSQGRELAGEFTKAFDSLAAATHRLRNLGPDNDIQIAALPSVAQLWLPQRLGWLRKSRPDLKFSVTALESPPRLTREFFDLSIFMTVPDPAAEQFVLAPDLIFPVCSPDLVDHFHFETAVLLHDQTWSDDWQLWSEDSGVSVGDPNGGPCYSLYSLAVEEAKAGAGLLMGHACLVDQTLKDGQLCRASQSECETGRALVLNVPDPMRRRSVVDEIVALLLDHR